MPLRKQTINNKTTKKYKEISKGQPITRSVGVKNLSQLLHATLTTLS
jgi:hypothetical protein